MTDTRGHRALIRLERHLGKRYGATSRLANVLGKPRSTVAGVLHGHYTRGSAMDLLDRIETILCRMDEGQSLEEAAR